LNHKPTSNRLSLNSFCPLSIKVKSSTLPDKKTLLCKLSVINKCWHVDSLQLAKFDLEKD